MVDVGAVDVVDGRGGVVVANVVDGATVVDALGSGVATVVGGTVVGSGGSGSTIANDWTKAVAAALSSSPTSV